ncbi:MAG: glycosyltransferase [Kiritimatiellia bacterium]
MSASPPIRFSVILPVHQGERYLDQALSSIANQIGFDLSQLELIAVEDGSSDRSPELLEKWRHQLPMRILTRKGGSNWMAATNAGLDTACGDWVCFLHQDDLWEPRRLQHLWRAITEHPQVDFFCHPVFMISPDSELLGRWSPAWPAHRPLTPSEALPRLAIQNTLSIPAPCFRRGLLKKTGPLREDLWFLADWDLWLRLVAAAEHSLCLPAPLARFRIHPDSQTATRSTHEADLRFQFAEIRKRVEELCGGKHPRQKAALVNEDLTLTLANWSHRQKGVPWRTLWGFLTLGPLRGWTFLRDTRIFERIVPRLKFKKRPSSEPPC